MTAETEKARAAQQDADLLDYLMRRFGPQVLKLAYYHVRDRHLAEDIFQEVFCRVYKNLDRFRQESSYFTWIYRITSNLCSDYLKTAYNRRILLGREPEFAGGDAEARAFEAVEGGEIFAKVMDLPLKYRMVIVLYYFEGMKTPEIAGVLRIGENAVRARLCRARNMLKESIEDLDHE